MQNYNGGLRNQTGTVLRNENTGEVVYTTPQHIDEIWDLLKNLELYINAEDEINQVDKLIKMSIIHYQFESIHPFFDGNGRTGRIINVLYLVLKGLLDIPVLYLSHYIIKHKDEYYRRLQSIRNNGSWKDWVIYMLSAVEGTAAEAISQIFTIKQLHSETKEIIKKNLPKIYSRDLLDSLFLHPYTRIDFIQSQLGISRQTALLYLNKLTEIDILEKAKFKNSYYFVNKRLFATLVG